MLIFQNKRLRLALGPTYYDRARSIDLHGLTNVPMIKTRMTALAVKTFRSLENTQCFKDLVLNHEIVQKRSGSNTILDELQSRLTHKQFYTVDSWRITVELLFPQRTGALREPFCVTHQKQGGLYHTTAWDKNTIDGDGLTDFGWTPVPTENRGSEGSRFVWHIKAVSSIS